MDCDLSSLCQCAVLYAVKVFSEEYMKSTSVYKMRSYASWKRLF
jgi:hypothetical protein